MLWFYTGERGSVAWGCEIGVEVVIIASIFARSFIERKGIVR
jgi:hypothetical protein